jgi:hypothetical protein
MLLFNFPLSFPSLSDLAMRNPSYACLFDLPSRIVHAHTLTHTQTHTPTAQELAAPTYKIPSPSPTQPATLPPHCCILAPSLASLSFFLCYLRFQESVRQCRNRKSRPSGIPGKELPLSIDPQKFLFLSGRTQKHNQQRALVRTPQGRHIQRPAFCSGLLFPAIRLSKRPKRM